MDGAGGTAMNADHDTVGVLVPQVLVSYLQPVQMSQQPKLKRHQDSQIKSL